MKEFVFIVVIILLACSCSKEEPSFEKKDKNGVVVDKSPVWYKRTSDEGTHGSLASTYTTYEGGYLAIQKESGKDFLVMLDAYTGETRWRWSDLLPLEDGYLGDIDISFPYQRQNVFIYNTGSRSYCIDLSNGNTNWKIRREKSYHPYLSFGESRFLIFETGGSQDSLGFGKFYEGNIENGELLNPITPPYLNIEFKNVNGGKGVVSNVKYFERNGYKYYLIGYVEPHLGINEQTPYVALFNITNQEWVYGNIKLSESGKSEVIDGPIEIWEDKAIFTVNKTIVCLDIWSGRQIWKFKSEKGNFLFGGHIVRYGRVYALAEGEAMYCLDVNAGYKIWSAHRPGTSSRMVEMNGVIYWRNGGDGLLYAVDAFTGKAYWKLESPDEKCCGQGFKRELAVLPAQNGKKPMVLTSTWIGAVGYEAVK